MYSNQGPRENLIIQIALAMIIVALIGITFIRASRSKDVPLPEAPNILPERIVESEDPNTETEYVVVVDEQGNPLVDSTSLNVVPRLVENINSDQTNIVKQYFAALANKDFTTACAVITPDKCRATNPASVQLFSREYNKLENGYEYTNIKDLGFRSPSNKDIVCVKYSYRYKQDLNPKLVTEIVSFYTAQVNGELKITDRVCEKKYKEGEGERPCPIEPNARYCIGNIK